MTALSFCTTNGYQSGFGNEFSTRSIAIPSKLTTTRIVRFVCRAIIRCGIHSSAQSEPAVVAVPDSSGCHALTFR